MKGKISQFSTDHAVSPVVGVMLMLVVVIIIAAVVSAYAGGMTSSQKNVPQATIRGEFSIQDGMIIQHAGGDPLPMADLVFTIWDGPTFGPNVEQITKQTLDLKNMTDSDGNILLSADGTYNRTSFKAGEYLMIAADYTSCDVFQPSIAPSNYRHEMGADYSETGGERRFALCIRNVENIGNKFVLTVSDKNGNLIGKTDVIIRG